MVSLWDMSVLSRILFPAAILTLTVAFASTPSREAPWRMAAKAHAPDTVIYSEDGYKLLRKGTMPDEKIPDSVLRKAGLKVKVNIGDSDEGDTVAVDTLSPEYLAKKLADSLEKAQKALRDSLRKMKEDEKALRDSIRDNTPRILETYVIPDSMQYKRIIAWTTDPDFLEVKPFIPDTTFNESYNDYPFFKKDVNASWLGVAGTPVQTYNFFKRDEHSEGVEFYRPLESWSHSPATMKFYNTKTPYTELGYFGTLFAGAEKESDNLHIFTTQNILPGLNFSLLFDRFGGGGIFQREKTRNANAEIGVNYLGKYYSANLGFIHDNVEREENGGIANLADVRDTLLETREIDVRLKNAYSQTLKNVLFLDHQVRIPFSFIDKIKEQKDSTFTAPEFNRDITSLYLGHSLDFSTYIREYFDNISETDATGRSVYMNEEGKYVTNYDPLVTNDSTRFQKLDNKIFVRLQPWSSEGIVSKLEAGAGDEVAWYSYGALGAPKKATENRFYIYAGGRGQFKKYFFWNAKAHFNLIGYRAGDFDIEAEAKFNMYPFRRARYSPLSIGAHFHQILSQPTFFQEHFYSNHYAWDNDFRKTSTTKIEGYLDIPHWRLRLDAGYALIAGNTYYDNYGIIRQHAPAMSVLSVNLKKNFTFWNALHLDNRILFQMSSNQDVLPLPMLALNLRWYGQFTVKRDEAGQEVMAMQIGINALYNTPWYAPAYNPATGVFQSQNTTLYTNGPIFDAFINVQWKRACVFVKFENLGQGWPRDKGKDYFTADRYLYTQRGFKFGILWPFYIQPTRNKKISFAAETK